MAIKRIKATLISSCTTHTFLKIKQCTHRHRYRPSQLNMYDACVSTNDYLLLRSSARSLAEPCNAHACGFLEIVYEWGNVYEIKCISYSVRIHLDVLIYIHSYLQMSADMQLCMLLFVWALEYDAICIFVKWRGGVEFSFWLLGRESGSTD